MANEEGDAKKGGGMMKLLMMAGGGLLLVALGAGAAWFLMPKPQAPAAEPGSEVGEEIVADAGHGGGHGESSGGHGEAADSHGGGHGESSDAHGGGDGGGSRELTRADLTLPFIERMTVNLDDPNGRWYVQISIEIVATSAEAVGVIEQNEAPLREATLMLLSSKTRDEIATPAGKERLKRELRARFEGLVARNTIEDVYLTQLIPVRQ